MATVTAAQVKALRELTDLPMMDCKKALTEADGDQAKAIEILKEAHKKVMTKRADNNTSEGQVFVAMKDDGSEAAMVEIQCESAPVATGEDLTSFGTDAVNHLLNASSANTAEELLAETADGADKSFSDRFDDMVGKIREKIVVNRIAKVSGPVGTYVHHDKKTGVLFSAEGEPKDAAILRDVAMHIAALQPTAVNPDDLDSAVVAAERDRLSEEARATGKPDNIIEKIVDGRMKAFYVEKGVLTYQPFAKDDSKTVEKALSEQGLTAKSFHRWVIGN